MIAQDADIARDNSVKNLALRLLAPFLSSCSFSGVEEVNFELELPFVRS